MGGFMRLLPISTALALFASLVAPAVLRGAEFYPPLPSAAHAINFDNRGFLIKGKRTFIASAGIEYARVPRPLWRDRLLRIKRSGFNCIEIYAFWNYHEVSPGKWDFTGDKDVGAFLDLAHQLGLYATVRVGPYVCAEWENGGIPMYLRFQPGLLFRQNEPTYLKDVDGWYDHILPIVASRQISRGGNVIMVQLENEDDEGWGTVADRYHDPYFTHLLDKARALGIDVLTFFSGMHHGGNPAPEYPISSTGRDDPWYTTEYWSGWYDMYGPLPATGGRSLTNSDRAAWRFLENGGNGFNVYMFHGGSNFATWNNNETVGSYDYAAAIGQAGDLRPIYYKYKRVALFGRSFQDILENCDNSTDAHQTDFPGLTIRARTGPAGTLEFLDNPGATPVDAHFPDNATLTVAPGEVLGLVRDFPVDDTFTLVHSESRILNIDSGAKETTLVMYGPVGSTGSIAVSSKAALQKGKDGAWTSNAAQPGISTLTVTFPSAHPELHVLLTNGRTLRVVTMSSELADDTYFIDGTDGNYIATGAPYIGEFTPEENTAPHFTMETPIDATTAPEVTIFRPDADKKPVVLAPLPLPALNPIAPVLADWQSASADAEAAPEYDDSAWKTSDAPLPMGADGDTSAYAWYRAKINSDTAGTQYLRIPFIGDHAILFVNGTRLPGTVGPGAVIIPVPLQAGPNSLAVLVSHSGRTKLIGTYGALDRLDMKGLVGPVTLLPTTAPLVVLDEAFAQDYWKGHPAVDALIDPNLKAIAPKWYRIGLHNNFGYVPQTWRDPFVVIRATLPDLPGPGRLLHVGMFDEKAAFYLNGQKIGQGYNRNWTTTPADKPADLVRGSLDLPLDAAWKTGGPNQLTIVLENSHAQATVGLLELTSGPAGTEVKGWKMRGNVTESTSPSLAWKSVPGTETTQTGVGATAGTANATPAPGVPTWYRTTFTLPEDYYTNATPILRLSSKGMSRGFAWLNGHNVGRFPERLAIDGLYLPECWLKTGAPNHLALIDDEGNAITPEHLYVELPASRRVLKR
jgi:beta-galactosidase